MEKWALPAAEVRGRKSLGRCHLILSLLKRTLGVPRFLIIYLRSDVKCDLNEMNITFKIVIKLRVADVPSATLLLGSSLNASNIKEGDDVYFECGVKSNPRPYKITWKHNVSARARRDDGFDF